MFNLINTVSIEKKLKLCSIQLEQNISNVVFLFYFGGLGLQYI